MDSSTDDYVLAVADLACLRSLVASEWLLLAVLCRSCPRIVLVRSNANGWASLCNYPVGPFDFNYPPFELMSIDETRILKDDAAAIDLVRQLVAEGEPLGLKAKAFLHKLAHDAIFQQED